MIKTIIQSLSLSSKTLFLLCFLCLFIFRPASAENRDTCRRFEFTLDDAVRSAMTKNREVLLAKAQTLKQRFAAAGVKAASGPLVSLNSQYYRIQDSRVPTFQGEKVGPDYNWLASIDASQTLYNAGRDGADQEEQLLIVKSLKEDQRKVINDTVAVVKEKFFDALKARDIIGLYNNAFSGTPTDKAENLLDSHESLEISLTELNRVAPLTQLSIGCLVPIGELRHDPVPISYERSIEDAKSKRPELKKWAHLKESTYASEKSARSGYYPSLSLLGSYGGESAVLEDRVGGEIHGWTVGMKASWDIFDSHLTDARVSETLADRKVYSANKAAAEEDVSLEVRKAQVELRSADRALNAVENRGKNRKFSFDEMLENIEALHRYNVAKAKLERATASEI